jgi:hypothetical protein
MIKKKKVERLELEENETKFSLSKGSRGTEVNVS